MQKQARIPGWSAMGVGALGAAFALWFLGLAVRSFIRYVSSSGDGATSSNSGYLYEALIGVWTSGVALLGAWVLLQLGRRATDLRLVSFSLRQSFFNWARLVFALLPVSGLLLVLYGSTLLVSDSETRWGTAFVGFGLVVLACSGGLELLLWRLARRD